MAKKNYCFLIDTSFDVINQTFDDNVYFLYPEVIRQKNNIVETFNDHKDISRDEILKSLNDKYDLKTSQTPYGIIESTIEKLVNEYEIIFIILITKEFSGMYQTCTNIAKNIGSKYNNKHIVVIDSKSISMFQNILMNDIKEMIEAKKSLKEIVKYANDFYKKTYAFTVITNATQLIKGGRLTGLKAILVKAFNVKLFIEYKNGKLTYVDKSRDTTKALEMGIDKMIKELELDSNQIQEICICSDLTDDETSKYYDFISEKFKKYYSNSIKISKLPAIIVTHLGDKSISILCKIK